MIVDYMQTPTKDVPQDWSVIDLERTVIESKTGIPVRKQDRKPGPYPYFGANGIIDYVHDYICDGEYVIVAQDGSIGSIQYFNGKFWPNNHVWVIRFNSSVYPRFMYYLLQALDWQRLAVGSTRPKITQEILLSIDIPIPPMDEQKKTAEALSCVDDGIRLADEAIARTVRLKKGLVQKLLTEGIGHTEYKQARIGKIPRAWKVMKIENLFDVVTGTTPSTKESSYWDDGTINWLTPTDLSKLSEQIFIEESERKITEAAMREANLKLLPKGSVILSTRAPVGYVAVLKEAATFNQGCKGLMPKRFEETNSEFYCYYLRSKRYMLENSSSGSTFKELSKARLESFSIPLASHLEQTKISGILSTFNQRIDVERKRKMKFERIRQGLMNDLLTGRRRVKVAM